MSATVKRQQGLSDLACCVAILIESSETSNTQLARSGLGTLFLGFRTSFASIRNCTVTPCHGGRTHVTRWRAWRGDTEKRTALAELRVISGRARRGRGAARLCPTQPSRPPHSPSTNVLDPTTSLRLHRSAWHRRRPLLLRSVCVRPASTHVCCSPCCQPVHWLLRASAPVA